MLQKTFYKVSVLAEQSLVFKFNTQILTDFIDQCTEAEFKEQIHTIYTFQKSFSTSLSKLAPISSIYDLGGLKHRTVIYMTFPAAFCF